MRYTAACTAAGAYVASVVAANVLTSHLGMVPVGFGLTVTAGTYAAGAALLARDVVQDTAGRRTVLAAIAAGAVLSAWLATPQLALASGVAFAASEVADMAIYTPLRRKGWARAVLASNVVGAVVDTVLFLALAGFPVMASLPGQLIGKALWATALPVLIVTAARRVRRAVSGDAVGA
ncbi:VUT family protein [Actinomadura montaniterrae]|uniref:VUT family protein n=1 Tax=Actinomadura montaniterrae TaxID=1803903 RepID=A0A6L3W0F9_9ACTN|nr:VUT family protein [Actinomadura montaniterrae]KAB2384729.1 VUT family protein [Actinomadura montaniterrae]